MKINNGIITLSKSELRKIYNNSSEENKTLLKEFFGEELFSFDYHDIKTFEDACRHLGVQYDTPYPCDGADIEAYKQSNALYKLLIIQKAINNDVLCDESGSSWYPYWVLYTKKEIEYMSEEAKQSKDVRQLLSCANRNITEGAGVSCAYANYSEGFTFTNDGYPFSFNSKEAALYAAKQFESIFLDYYGLKVKSNG